MAKNKEKLDVYSTKTAEKVAKLEKKKAALVEKRNSINASIKEIDKELSAANAEWKNEKVDALLGLATNGGFNIDDLLSAASSGDFLTLQEKIEKAQTKTADNLAEEAENNNESESSEFEDIDVSEENPET